ncbi:hypothetical protein Neosp_008974 [[Neocosmospora] mangrovei]
MTSNAADASTPAPMGDTTSQLALQVAIRNLRLEFQEELFRHQRSATVRAEMDRKSLAHWKERTEKKIGSLEAEIRRLQQENDRLKAWINKAPKSTAG